MRAWVLTWNAELLSNIFNLETNSTLCPSILLSCRSAGALSAQPDYSVSPDTSSLSRSSENCIRCNRINTSRQFSPLCTISACPCAQLLHLSHMYSLWPAFQELYHPHKHPALLFLVPRRLVIAPHFISRRLCLSHQECKLGVTVQSRIPSQRDRVKQPGKDLWETRPSVSDWTPWCLWSHVCARFLMGVASLNIRGKNLRLASKSWQGSVLSLTWPNTWCTINRPEIRYAE